MSKSRVAHGLLLVQVLIFYSALGFAAAALGQAQNNPTDLVLVSQQALPWGNLSTLELRKVFLGLPVTQNGQELSAVIYQPDEATRDIFLKAIVGMTSRTYHRKLLQARLSFGARIVPLHSSLQEVLDSVREQDLAISFMTYSDAQLNGLEVVQTLWQDES